MRIQPNYVKANGLSALGHPKDNYNGWLIFDNSYCKENMTGWLSHNLSLDTLLCFKFILLTVTQAFLDWGALLGTGYTPADQSLGPKGPPGKTQSPELECIFQGLGASGTHLAWEYLKVMWPCTNATSLQTSGCLPGTRASLKAGSLGTWLSSAAPKPKAPLFQPGPGQ